MSGAVVALAVVTMLLYLALALACGYFLLKYREIQRTPALVGHYDEPKMLFFLVLLVAALLDAPLYFACAVRGGPSECEWGPPPPRGEDAGYAVCWSLHLLATCGYVYAILTPAVLWNDIIAPTFSGGITSNCEYRDGLLLCSATPLDATKIFFRCAFCLYCAVQMMSVVAEIAAAAAAASNSDAVAMAERANEIGNCLEPVLILGITAGCLWCGLRLQRYVIRVQLGSAAERKVLAQLNYTLAIIVVSYLLRALLVLSLFDGIPKFVYLVPTATGSYAVWLLGTRWMPNIFCSFFLLRAMRFSAMKDGDRGARGSSKYRSSHSHSYSRGSTGAADDDDAAAAAAAAKFRPLLECRDLDADGADGEFSAELPREFSEGTTASRGFGGGGGGGSGFGSVRSASFGFFSEPRSEFFNDDGDFFRRVQQNSVDFSAVTPYCDQMQQQL